jgi:hypothetical protein
MEVVDSALVFALLGAMDPGLADPLFKATLALAVAMRQPSR